jgi:hypothetical protein
MNLTNIMNTKLILTVAVLFCAAIPGIHAATPPAKVPGVVIDHIPASTGVYVGSPSIAILPNGDYVASHDHFGPKTKEHESALTAVFRSADRGKIWKKVSEVQGAFWSSLFVHRGALYLLGPHKHYGNILIRRSNDGGSTWTTPTSSTTGVLRDNGEYHCAPMPVIEHAGRLWRGFEWRNPPVAWGINYRATMLSAPVDADLLNAASWTLADPLPSDRSWNGGDMGAWLEGNAVVTPAGDLVDILRVQTKSLDEKAAIVRVSADGRKMSFDPATGFVPFPGGAKKFTIRFDRQSKLYWSLASIVHERHRIGSPGGIRNTLALTCSPDLKKWTVRCILLYHPDVKKHGFQYVDWLFDGDDIIAASRTAYDDGLGGAHNAHDANYLTFHRIANFRAKTMRDSVPITLPPPARAETADLVVTGDGWTLAALADNEKAFGNRPYVWKSVPEKFRGWRITQTLGGEQALIRVKAKRDTTLFATTTAAKQTGIDVSGWNTAANAAFHYTDKGKTAMTVFCRALKAGEELVVPQGNWSGMMALLPPDGASIAALVAAAQPLERLKYNNPGLVVDLGVGLWAWPLPMDFDGDGDLDLVVNCPDKPYNGVYFFENASGDTAKNKMPVFKPAKRISKGLQNVQVSYVDGKPRVMSPATEHPDFLKTGLDNGVKLPLPPNIHPNKVRANMWRQVDYDGDGKLDIIVGVGDWTEYGWDNAYTPSGTWTNGPIRGFVYVLRNSGTNEKPVYDKPAKVMAGGKPVETFGWPSPNFADFDGDGDLDLLCGEFLDGFTYFENIGTRTAPKYAPGRRLTLPADAKGFPAAWLATREAAKLPDKPRPLTMDLEMITPTAIDWDKDGDLDLIVGDEDGRVAFIENTGKLTADHTPQFLPPRYFQQEADDLKCGALATPVGFDWDGDGDTDIISGNTAGYIAFFENLSGPGVEKPKWAAPKNLRADGKVIRIMAGPNGSIQGPCEAKWGYTTQTVADWDGDGLPDIIANSILGKVVWFKNVGTRKAPKLAAAQPVEVEWDGPQPTLAYGWLRPKGKELLTQWRTTPVAVDWNKDGLTDLAMLDQEGYFAFFERARRDSKIVLLPPKRVFCDEKGEPLRLNAGIAGRSGRRKLCIVDWDGDGKLDILANAANAKFYRQVGARDGKWLFKDMGLLVEQNIEGHDVSPTVVDFNGDGIPDFLGGAEDGRFYYLRNARTK